MKSGRAEQRGQRRRTHANNKGNYVLGASEGSGVSASLAFHGGPTKTHALFSTSPAIYADTSDVFGAFFADLALQDQRKPGRIIDWDGIGGERFDIGAVELALGGRTLDLTRISARRSEIDACTRSLEQLARSTIGCRGYCA